MISTTPDLKIDYREQRSGIIAELEKIGGKFTYKMVALPVGDYNIADKIIIERKTIHDFLVSIKDGRIFRQAYRIAQSGMNGVIIIEGDELQANLGNLSPKAYQGVLIHLSVLIGIPVMHTLDIQATASLLQSIIHQCDHEKLPHKNYNTFKSKSIRLNNKQKQKLNLLLNIPGIGCKKGLLLLEAFNTIEKLVQSSPSELMKVKGIGRKLSTVLFQILH